MLQHVDASAATATVSLKSLDDRLGKLSENTRAIPQLAERWKGLDGRRDRRRRFGATTSRHVARNARRAEGAHEALTGGFQSSGNGVSPCPPES